ncbi:MCE family protein [Mycolicibacterium sp. GF69]|uniref:MlaD family protein n=1 Tax=Mycolicibacterium sp. GF69 TaxID=2267251 RepID=UPI000DCC6D19|nr:MlaD family protein [Mycolicibacterium sp. GF69]RAV18364.1 MCE family protein [Mycolicibacterium sp. GF69]
MQPLRRLSDHPILLGIGALVMVAVIAVAAAVVYLSPPNQQVVTFHTADSAAVRAGDAVRIAGVNVGRIKDLAIAPDHVEVRATVDKDVFVGDQSQIQVRMRTVVGGYYTAIVSLGDEPLGDKAIPVERVTMPYNLVRTVTDATGIADDVDAKPIRESLDNLQRGLAGNNVETLSAIMDAGNSLTAAIDQQRGQISSILNMSDEYIHALSNYTGQLKQMIRKVSVIEQTLTLYSQGFGQALKGMGDVLDSLNPVGQFYAGHRDKFIEKVRNLQEMVQTWADRSGLVVRGLRRVRDKLDRVLDAQNARPDLLATDLCIPVPGSAC